MDKSDPEILSTVSIADIMTLAESELPFAFDYGIYLREINDLEVIAVAPFSPKLLRPGGTIAGPVMMGLADFAVYAAILARIGLVKMAVTTSLSMNFLRRPGSSDVVAHARLIKLGRRLAVGSVEIYSNGDPQMVAHASATYSIPPDGK